MCILIYDCTMSAKETELYTTEEAARRLGRKVATVRQYASNHQIGRIIGGVRFLSDADLRAIAKAKPGAPRRKRSKST